MGGASSIRFGLLLRQPRPHHDIPVSLSYSDETNQDRSHPFLDVFLIGEFVSYKTKKWCETSRGGRGQTRIHQHTTRILCNAMKKEQNYNFLVSSQAHWWLLKSDRADDRAD